MRIVKWGFGGLAAVVVMLGSLNRLAERLGSMWTAGVGRAWIWTVFCDQAIQHPEQPCLTIYLPHPP